MIRPVPTADGVLRTPSVVGFDDHGEVLIGAAAVRHAGQSAKRIVYGAKRLLGRKYRSAGVDYLRKTLTYNVVEAANGDAWIRVDDRDLSPEALLALLLAQLKRDAELAVGHEVTRAAVSVPAHFNDTERRAMANACKLAGLSGAMLVNDTTAAMLAHAAERRGNVRTAVIDLGAGSFDIAIIERTPTLVRVRAAAGDSLLGGEEFDRRIVGWMVQRFEEVHGVRPSRAALRKLYMEAAMARYQLSQPGVNTIQRKPSIPIREGLELELDVALTRELFAELVQHEIAALSVPCRWVLEDLQLGTKFIDEVVLVGGGTLMPVVKERIEFLFQKPASYVAEIDHAVAVGAALAMAPHETLRASVEDVTTHSLRLRVPGGTATIINRQESVPCRARKAFTLARQGQHHLFFEIYQGESESIAENHYVGRFVLDNLTPGHDVVVAFSVNAEGMVHLSHRDPQAGMWSDVPLRSSGGLSEAQLETLAAELWQGGDRPSLDRLTPASLPPPSSGRELHPSERPPAAPRLPTHQGPEETVPREVGDDALVGSVLGGRYLIEGVIADGGMGRVYRASHRLKGTALAVKVLHPQFAARQDVAARFVREAQSSARIRDEHVVSILDFGRLEDGTAYFVMELAEGRTLRQLIESKVPLTNDVREIALQLARGLVAAHGCDIVHRDLKPANVMVSRRDDGSLICKILDFGIAKQATADTSDRITLAGNVVGTPHYMAPEQFEHHVDARVDIYALGAVLYEAATGVPPFDAPSAFELYRMHREDTPFPIGHFDECAGFPSDLEAVVDKCLAKRPDERYQTASELLTALLLTHG